MAMTKSPLLNSATDIALATRRLYVFCQEEYDYYDGLPPSDPNVITPSDVLAAVSMNAFYNANATKIRNIHRSMAKSCTPLLSAIPLNDNLLDCTPSTIVGLERLFRTATQIPGVLIPVATKVLHRKRPQLIPMLDNVVLAYYLDVPGPNNLPGNTQDKAQATSVAIKVITLFRQDLQNMLPAIESIQRELLEAGFVLTHVRILELLVWIYTEQHGYYRTS